MVQPADRRNPPRRVKRWGFSMADHDESGTKMTKSRGAQGDEELESVSIGLKAKLKVLT